MRTTLDLNDALLAEARRIAAERHSSLTAVVEDGLRAIVGSRLRDAPATTAGWPVSYDARPVAGVDLTSTSALLERSDEPA